MVKKKAETILKKFQKKLKHKGILKSEKPTLTIYQKEIPSVLGDTNRFFKDEIQKEFEL